MFIYLSARELEIIHNTIIYMTGGVGGVNKGILDACAKRPAEEVYDFKPFPTIFMKAAALMEAIIKWHPFVDGNKRTALAAVRIFLADNGWLFEPGMDAVQFTVDIAVGKRNLKEITRWIEKHSTPKR